MTFTIEEKDELLGISQHVSEMVGRLEVCFRCGNVSECDLGLADMPTGHVVAWLCEHCLTRPLSEFGRERK